MSRLLWQKAGVTTDAAVMRFLAGEDVILDRELFPFDIRATDAHARGLASRGLLSAEDAEAITAALQDLDAAWSAGRFVLDDRFEDGHSAIESYLTDRLGEVGGRVHLGRSRNDQVLVATRLYMIDALDALKASLVESANAALERARRDEMAPMPLWKERVETRWLLCQATPISSGRSHQQWGSGWPPLQNPLPSLPNWSP